MKDKKSSQFSYENPDAQENVLLSDGITPSQEQTHLSSKPPKSLVEWLVRVHLRLQALDEEKKKDG